MPLAYSARRLMNNPKTKRGRGRGAPAVKIYVRGVALLEASPLANF